ncbi:MAG: amino acid ABC transporter substrate-binding protein [Clostridia bacterium]|nr:amino acid ABC transporter substrate-binding protein [Clostridia bacterium]
MFSRLWWVLLLLFALLPVGMAEEMQFMENEYNFVDGSMDVSGGIPETVDESLRRIRDSGVLRVATEPYFAPQEFIDPSLEGQDQYVGADIELAKRIAERMGVRLEIVPMEFTEVLPAVADGLCDLAISGLAFTPGRASQVELSKGYHYTTENTGSRLLIREEDRDAITCVEDLAKRKIAAQRGSLQETLMADNVPEYQEFRRLSTSEEVYEALRTGAVDAIAVDYENVLAYIEANPDCGLMVVPGIEFVLEPQFDGDRVAGKKDCLVLMYFVNGVIDEVLLDGTYQKWFDEYSVYARRIGQ